MTTSIILMAIGIVFIMEGIGPLLFPNKWKAYMTKLSTESPDNLRKIGIGLVLIGCIFLFL